MNALCFRTRVGSKAEATSASLVRPAHLGHVNTATTIAVITLAHFTAQVLLIQSIVVKWLVLFSIGSALSARPPLDITLPHSTAFHILQGLTQPIRSLPLPSWLWQNPLTAFVLVTLNSAIWGGCLGALARISWKLSRNWRASEPQ